MVSTASTSAAAAAAVDACAFCSFCKCCSGHFAAAAAAAAVQVIKFTASLFKAFVCCKSMGLMDSHIVVRICPWSMYFGMRPFLFNGRLWNCGVFL